MNQIDTWILPTPEIGVRVQFRCEWVVRRRVNCPELESDPNFFVSAGRSFTRPANPQMKAPLSPGGVRGAGGERGKQINQRNRIAINKIAV